MNTKRIQTIMRLNGWINFEEDLCDFLATLDQQDNSTSITKHITHISKKELKDVIEFSRTNKQIAKILKEN